jgi:hypothetical protein
MPWHQVAARFGVCMIILSMIMFVLPAAGNAFGDFLIAEFL